MRILSFVISFFALIALQCQLAFAQDTLSGDWKGAIDVHGKELIIITHFNSVEDGFEGTIDIPQQGGQDIYLQNINLSDQDSVQFEFMAGLGMESFQGKVEGDQITGTFHQNNQTFPFELKRQTSLEKVTAENAEMLTISSGDVMLGGTLSLPDKTPSACVILLSGSGAQDRDSSAPEPCHHNIK